MTMRPALASSPRAPAPDLQRRRLLWALPGSLAMTSPLALIGCGGSDDDALPTAAARVALPPGSSLQVGSLQVVNAYGAASVGATGTVQRLEMGHDDPTVALVVDADGRVVLFGHVDPDRAEADNPIDATSVAVALVFFALNGMSSQGVVRRTVLRLLRQDAAVSTLAAVIAARLAAAPYALDGEDAEIQQALADAVGTITASAAQAPQRLGTTRERAQAVRPQVLVEPGGPQSGVELVQDTAADGTVRPVNHARRECAVYAYRVAYSTAEAPETRIPLAVAELLNTGDGLRATSALGGAVTTIGELITGNTALAPVTGRALTLAQKEGDARTWCEVVVIGASSTSTEPAFFATAPYAGEVERWREARGRLNAISWLRDVLFGLLLEVWGVRDLAVATIDFANIAAAWEAIDDDVLRTIIRRARSGAMAPALARAVRAAVEDNGLALAKLGPLLSGVLDSIAARRAVVSATLLRSGLRALGAMLSAAPGAVLGAIDLGLVLRDLDAAQQGDLWTATLVRPSVTLAPATGKVERGGELELSVNVTAAPADATFVYRWTLEGSDLADLFAEGRNGRVLETSGRVATLAVTPSTQGILTVTVEAFVVDGSTRESAGTATSRLEVSDTFVSLSPSVAHVSRNGGGQALRAVVTAPETLDRATLRYEWTCPSQYGSVTSGGLTTSASQPTITSTSSSAMYTVRSGLVGGETEPVQVVVHTGNRNDPIGDGSATVQVQLPFAIELVPLPPETPTDNTLGVTATIVDDLPAGTSVRWTWTHRGAGTLRPPSDDANQRHSVASFDSGPTEGQAIFTVEAQVIPPGGQPVVVLPMTVATQVKRGLRQITFVASGGVFGCTDPRACGVSAYTAYIVPRYSKATGYLAVFSGFGYPSCNRAVSWNGPVRDGGGCSFPISYHPHNSSGPTGAWAVWIGFGGPLPADGICTITVTLAP